MWERTSKQKKCVGWWEAASKNLFSRIRNRHRWWVGGQAGEDFATVFQNQIARYHSSGTEDSPSILRGAVKG